MRLIQNHIMPRLATEHVLICQYELIGCHTDVELILGIPAFSFLFSFFDASVVSKDLEAGQELFELHLPVQHLLDGH